MVAFDRDEEKKMGTLVKEDFGCPNRENTMVSALFRAFANVIIFSLFIVFVFVTTETLLPFAGNATWIL